jgi:hypothetical protein
MEPTPKAVLAMVGQSEETKITSTAAWPAFLRV